MPCRPHGRFEYCIKLALTAHVISGNRSAALRANPIGADLGSNVMEGRVGSKGGFCSWKVSNLLVAVASFCLAAGPAGAGVTIESLRIGFGPPERSGDYKVATWVPARVLIRAEAERFDGLLELRTADSDDVAAAVVRPVHVPPNETVTVPTYVRPGKLMPSIVVRLIGPDGRERASRRFSAAENELPDAADLSTILFVTVGAAGGLLPARIGLRPGYPAERFAVARQPSCRTLPRRWFGYQGIDFLVLCLSDPGMLEEFDAAGRAALVRWVRFGGHLVLAVGSYWTQLRNSFLAELLPAKLAGQKELKDLRIVESYVGSAKPIRMKDLVVVPKLAEVRGRILVGTKSLPLAVTGPAGLGRCTLIALEADREPFLSWEGNTDFWLKVLDIEKERTEEELRAWRRYAANDLSSQLRHNLEQFEGVRIVPFGLVACFIFLYILVIGPLDYLFVRYVLKRMELSWVTFPATVVCVSLLGYYSARAMKGTELRMNQIELVDVQTAEGLLRGTSWFTIFSPKRDLYTIEVAPCGPMYAGPVDSRAGEPAMNMSWLGLAEDAIAGMGRPAGLSVFRRGYRFGPEATRIEQVPIPIWSTKGFTARWHGRAKVCLETELLAIGLDRLKGSIVNRSETPLANSVLVFGRRAYQLGTLKPGVPVLVQSVSPEDLYGHLQRRAGLFRASGSALYVTTRGIYSRRLSR